MFVVGLDSCAVHRSCMPPSFWAFEVVAVGGEEYHQKKSQKVVGGVVEVVFSEYF